MKNFIKKIIVGILSFTLLITAQNVFASSVTWNQASNDCKSISIINATTNQGYASPCWAGTSVSADMGEVINVRIYYHNTGTDTATNTHVMLIPNSSLSSSSTTKSFYGRITSDQGSVSFSQTVTANLSSSQSLSFLSAKWYTNNTSETLTSPLDGQSGNEVLTDNGLAIGSITSGWSSQGSVVVAFRVSSTVAPQLCKDTSATNYNGALPCQYPAQLCRDTSATNYLGALPCQYPAQLCRDTSATNYLGALPCTYPQLCRDTSATNYLGALPCTYPQLCRDTSATNYLGALPCQYPAQLCRDTSATNYLGALPCTYPQPVYCTILNFSANPASITSGNSSSLSWSTSNCTNVTISNLSYSVPTSGVQAVWPTSTKTYTLTARSSTGATQTRTAVVYVNDNNNNNCSITNFSASDTNINDGDSSILRWDTNNCDRVKISSIGDVNESGSRTVYPSDDTTYTLTAYNTDGSSETDTVRIYVDNNNNNNNNCTIDSFNSNKINVNSGDAVTLRWSTSDCDSANISNLGNVSLDGSRIIYPTYSTSYTLRASGNSTDTRTIQINVNNNYTPVTPIYNSNVVTTVATNISQTGAQLNGIVTNSVYGNANTYFQYGTTVNMGIRTATRTVNGNSNFNDFVSNLSSNTIYYFQAFSEDTNGVSQGAIQVFKTLGYSTGVITTPVKQVIIQGPTVSSSSSPIVLRIENKYQSFGIGDIVDYTVYYKNISSSKLTHPMVQVIIPEGITLTNTSRGTYSENDRTLSVPIEDLNPNDEGVIYLQARVDSLDANLAQIVTTAILVYTNPNGAQENAMAYVLNNPKVTNLLGASAFFGNIFGLGLLGWLILIILILLLVLIARSLYNQKRRNVVTTTTQKTISQ
jgi:hypothetical protein